MNQQVSKSEFKAKALKFFRQIEASKKPMVVTDHNKPRLEVRIYQNTERNPLDILRGSVVRFDHPMDPVTESDWEVLQ